MFMIFITGLQLKIFSHEVSAAHKVSQKAASIPAFLFSFEMTDILIQKLQEFQSIEFPPQPQVARISLPCEKRRAVLRRALLFASINSKLRIAIEVNSRANEV
jgi:hypothetical protein